MLARQIQKTETSHVAANGTRDVTTDTRMIIVRSFAQAGPWALLTLLLVAAGMWEAHYFVSQYVSATADHIARANQILNKIVDNETELVRSNQLNSELIRTNSKTLEEVAAVLRAANQTMAEVPAERKEQTRLLNEILKATKENQ